MKRVVITGGTGGLGSAVASVFREGGWDVATPGRDDLCPADAPGTQRYFRSNPCELLVCAAGATDDIPLARMDEASWDDVLAVNFTFARNCADAVLTGMAERGKGHVVFISSHAALHPAIGQAAYATAKEALLGLTESLAGRWGGSGIRVNAVLPGFMETRMTAAVSEKRRGVIRGEHHLGVFNTPTHAAEFIRFLHERMPHTSGQVFQLDSRRGFF